MDELDCIDCGTIECDLVKENYYELEIDEVQCCICRGDGFNESCSYCRGVIAEGYAD